MNYVLDILFSSLYLIAGSHLVTIRMFLSFCLTALSIRDSLSGPSGGEAELEELDGREPAKDKDEDNDSEKGVSLRLT